MWPSKRINGQDLYKFMPKPAQSLTKDEMRQMFELIPIFNEQMRARIIQGFAGRGVVKAWCQQVDPSRRFLERVRAFARGEVHYLDLWELLNLYAVMADQDPPVMRRNPKPGNTAPNRRTRWVPPAGHKALSDV